MTIPTTIYIISMGFSNNNGDDIGQGYTTTNDLDIINRTLYNPLYNYSHDGDKDSNGDHIDDSEYFYSSYLYDHGEGIFLDTITDPERIISILYSPNTLVLGYENLHIYPSLPSIQGPDSPILMDSNNPDSIPF